ncbi:MAG TPA: hypothetical protein VM778_01730 [Gemmatimonadota bacterium]|nr:hypothetical protein [Gemmatimonadota bacterium]
MHRETLGRILLIVAVCVVQAAEATAIPLFARRYNVSCQQCHVAPPKLNAFGEQFRARGYRMPPGFRSRGTIPLAVWMSGRSDALHDESDVSEAVRAYLNKVEIISGGAVVAPWLRYFVEWRMVSLETQRRDGRIRLRDRSGRFEDLFLVAAADNLDIAVGQYRQLNQVDVSLRLGLSEPLVLASGLPGSDEGLARDPEGDLTTAASRQLSLRAFSPAGRSPSVRVGWTGRVGTGWDWTTFATLPLPGEFSIPLTSEARIEASNELELEPKGVFVESYIRRGLTSFGAHAFYDHSERYLLQAVTTGSRGSIHWTAIAGLARVGDPLRGRWSVEGEYIPHYFIGIGARLEDLTGDEARRGFIPYVSAHFPGTRYTVRLTVEQRLQRGNDATLIELGTVF